MEDDGVLFSRDISLSFFLGNIGVKKWQNS
jgi:hypothetical protein